MIVSWNWLKQYVPLEMDPAEVEHRLAMSGLNHEGTESLGDDLAIDLEVTSNRGDCLGHIGVAREIAVLWDKPLSVPDPQPAASGPAVDQLTSVTLECPDLCPRYTARVVRGVKVGASPDWLARRLQSVGVNVINNIVDITNFVLLECGQPLHAFDLARLNGRQIIVRRARKGEKFQAIDHKTYELEGQMCVIADAQRAVALAGVMGGADSEVSEGTTELLIESAEFAPLSVRNTARRLNLHSPSSYRFERGVDPEAIDWASRRCCELILELAGGELAEGVVDVGRRPAARSPIVLRLAQLERILGIEVPVEDVQRILAALGGEVEPADAQTIQVVPPSWRRDLTREIDLVEEVARVHGYDQIPEDVSVPMAPSHRRDEDRVLEKVRQTLIAAGFDEAMTASVVSEAWENAFSPWTAEPPLQASVPMLKGADRLRRSLTPSLLEARRLNQAIGNSEVELFETARVYLPRKGQLPLEQWTLGITSGRGYYRVKGVIESLVAQLQPRAKLEWTETKQELLDGERSCELHVDGRRFAVLGELAPQGLKTFGLRSAAAVAELNLDVLARDARLISQFQTLSPYPAISQDLNLVVDEAVRWADLAATVRKAGGDVLEQLEYRETYRNKKQDGGGKKRLLLTITLRDAERTLTTDEANALRDSIVTACQKEHGAQLLG